MKILGVTVPFLPFSPPPAGDVWPQQKLYGLGARLGALKVLAEVAQTSENPDNINEGIARIAEEMTQKDDYNGKKQ